MQNHPYREKQIVKKLKPQRGEFRIRQQKNQFIYYIERYRWFLWIPWFGFWSHEDTSASEKNAIKKVKNLIEKRSLSDRILWTESDGLAKLEEN